MPASRSGQSWCSASHQQPQNTAGRAKGFCSLSRHIAMLALVEGPLTRRLICSHRPAVVPLGTGRTEFGHDIGHKLWPYHESRHPLITPYSSISIATVILLRILPSTYSLDSNMVLVCLSSALKQSANDTVPERLRMACSVHHYDILL